MSTMTPEEKQIAEDAKDYIHNLLIAADKTSHSAAITATSLELILSAALPYMASKGSVAAQPGLDFDRKMLLMGMELVKKSIQNVQKSPAYDLLKKFDEMK